MCGRCYAEGVCAADRGCAGRLKPGTKGPEGRSHSVVMETRELQLHVGAGYFTLNATLRRA